MSGGNLVMMMQDGVPQLVSFTVIVVEKYKDARNLKGALVKSIPDPRRNVNVTWTLFSGT